MTSLRKRISRSSGYRVCCSASSPFSLQSNLTITTDSAFHLTSTATLIVRCALKPRQRGRKIMPLQCRDPAHSTASSTGRRRLGCSRHVSGPLRTNYAPTSRNRRYNGSDIHDRMADNGLVNPAAISLPETQTNNDIVDDMMSISNTFGTMEASHSI